jgi:capsular exopolysaccharide synthesis family protein
MREAAGATREAAKAEFDAALRREESLKTALSRQRSQALAETTDLAQYNELKAEVDTQRALLDTLMRRAAETEVLARMQGERISNVSIVESALPPRHPFTPSTPRNAAAALALGLLAGVGLAVGTEYMDRSLKTRDDVRNVLHLPVLGAIPKARVLAMGRNVTVHDIVPVAASGGAEEGSYPVPPWAAAYRALRTSLLVSRGEATRVIAITSAVPFEGKTSTALNLAVALAQLGKRVLVVDCDLHKPQLAEALGLPQDVGLAEVLSERAERARAVYATRIPGLFALVAGSPVPDPSAILHSEAMGRLLAELRAEFDHVVLDTPPVLAVPDAVLIGRDADGVVLCIKGGGPSREQVVRARDELLQARVRILGVVINGFVVEDEGEKSYAYGAYGRRTSSVTMPVSASWSSS